MRQFSGEFWFYILAIFFGECCNGPFLDNLTDLLLKRFGIPYTTAGALTMIPCGLSPVCALVWYYFLSRFPNRRRLIMVCIACLSLALHVTVLLIPNSGEPGFLQYFLVALALLCYAFAYAGFLGVLNSSVTMIVPPNLVGTAYGALGFVDTLGMGLMPIFNGLIASSSGDETVGYKRLQYLFAPLSAVYLGLTCVVLASKRDNFRKFD